VGRTPEVQTDNNAQDYQPEATRFKLLDVNIQCRICTYSSFLLPFYALNIYKMYNKFTVYSLNYERYVCTFLE